MQKGTTVTVQEGTYADRTFRFNTLDPVIGDTDLEIDPDPIPLTPANAPLSPLDFGCTLDGADSSTGFGLFIDAMVAQGRPGELPEGTITLASKITRNIGAAALSLKGRGVDSRSFCSRRLMAASPSRPPMRTRAFNGPAKSP